MYQKKTAGIMSQQACRIIGIAGLLSICIVAGCSRKPAATSNSKPLTTDAPSTARAALENMLAAYRQASSYQDEAYVQLRYVRAGQAYEDRSPVRVSWQAPNRIFIRAYEVQLASDGKQLRARIRDRATHDFDGQVVERPVSSRLELEDLYRGDNILSLALRQGLVGYPLQLDLLLAPHPLAIMMNEKEVTHSLLAPASIGNKLCDRVQMQTGDGTFVFWIDRKEHLLRRVEYPVAAFAPDVAADRAVSNAQLTVEFANAAVDVRLAEDTFQLDVPNDAKLVRQFIPPPRQLASDLFGKQIGPFAFRTVSGDIITRDQLGDAIKVLVWFNNHPACKATLQQMNEVYKKYRDRKRFRFLAVCVEPSSTTDQQIASLMQLWQVQIPVVRDLEAYGRDVFHIPWAPTMVILDSENTLHIFEVGYNQLLAQELPQVLTRLAAGDNLAAEILTQFHQQQERYQRQLKEGVPDTTTSRRATVDR